MSDPEHGHTTAESRETLLRIANRIFGDSYAAEDVVQQAFVRFIEQRDATFDSPRAWLSRVTRNLAIDRYRRMRRESAAAARLREQPGTEQTPREPDEELTWQQRLQHLLRVLLEGSGPRDTATVLLREVFGTDYVDIARASGCSTDACREVVSRSLGRARRTDAGGLPEHSVAKETGQRFEDALLAENPEPLFDACTCRPSVRITPASAPFERLAVNPEHVCTSS